MVDTYGIELIHPLREGCSKQQIGKKGKSNGRWIVGIKLAWLINEAGEVVDWTWATANEPDNVFRPLATGYDGETIALADQDFREKDAPTQEYPVLCVGHLERAFYHRNQPELGDGAVSCQEVVTSRQGASGSSLMVSGRADQLSAADHRAQTLAGRVCHLITSTIG